MHDKRFEHVSSAVIFLTTIEYGTSSSSVDPNQLFIWVFHISFVDGWQEQVMPLDVHVIDKALPVQTMIIQKKYKQQTVIHRPNTVYLKGIGRPIKKHYRIKNYSAKVLVGMTSSNKARKCNICTIVFLTQNVTFQQNLISIFNFLRNYSRRPYLQNKGNMMSKQLRS